MNESETSTPRAQVRAQAPKRSGIVEKSRAQGIVSPMTQRLMTLKQAAQWLGLTTWAMRERIWAGQIPVVRFPGGRKMYVDTKDLDSFIQKNKEVIR
jgi:hypothetical protein